MTLPTMKYNPAFLDEETLVQSFVARRSELRLILEIVRENTGESNQHVLIVGPRGMGKTTLALRIVAETQMDEALSDAWYPIVFGEESYQVTTPGEFWLEALFHLGEQTGESRWQESYEELRRESEEERLCQRALAQLMDFADEREKRILLVAENLNMLLGDQVGSDDAWTLRHTLLNEPRLMLLGTATSRFEEIKEYGKPMYELFKIVDLDPLDDGEIRALWKSVTGEEAAQNEVRPIQILTGGNPRLIRIISEFAADTSFRDLMENLTQLVDEHTEYFKRHLDSLSPQERKVFVALADLWDPATTQEVAEVARLDTNRTSAVLGRLKDRGAVTVVGKRGRAKYYQVAERMYNIYHLMRRRGRAASRVRAVVRFMIHLYSGKELVDTVMSIAEEAKDLTPEQREEHFRAYEAIVSMTQDPELEAQIVKEAGPLFSALPDAPQFVMELTSSSQGGEQELSSDATEEDRKRLINLDIGEVDDINTLIEIGDSHLRSANFEEAKMAYEKALKKDPKNRKVLDGLLEVVRLGGYYEDTLSSFENAIEVDPSVKEAWYGKGAVLFETKHFQEALEAFEEVLRLDQTDVGSWVAKGGVLWELEQYREALEALNQALEYDEESAPAWGAKGIVLEDFGRYEEALNAYDQALELSETDLKVLRLKGTLLNQLGRHEDALETFDQGLTRSEGTSEELWCGRGEALRGLERYKQSLKSYQWALELDETNVRAWWGRGFILQRMGRPEEALEAYSRVLDLDQTDAHAHLNRGLILWETERYEEALKALNQSLKYNEESASAWLVKGIVLEETGQYEEALDALERTTMLDESVAGAWYNKGLVLERLGRYGEAAEATRRALDLGFEEDAAWRLLLDLYTLHLSKPDKALSTARSYLEASEHSSEALNSVAWAFSRAGWDEHLPQAETWARRATEQEPDNANYHQTLASILGAQNKWEGALDHTSVYLENPEIVGETLDDAIEFFVAAAATGHPQEALQCIQGSPSTEVLEPMVVALRMDQGEDVTIAAEIEEVASDVLERIEERREERSE